MLFYELLMKLVCQCSEDSQTWVNAIFLGAQSSTHSDINES